MPKVTAAVLAALVALSLTGCAGTGESAPEQPTAPAESESVAPLVAEEPATGASEEDTSEAEASFLEAFRDIQTTYASVIPDATDEQLLEAGYEACERLAAGEASTDISLIDGEQRNTQSLMFLDSVSIIGAAVPHLCP